TLAGEGEGRHGSGGTRRRPSRWRALSRRPHPRRLARLPADGRSGYGPLRASTICPPTAMIARSSHRIDEPTVWTPATHSPRYAVIVPEIGRGSVPRCTNRLDHSSGFSLLDVSQQ